MRRALPWVVGAWLGMSGCDAPAPPDPATTPDTGMADGDGALRQLAHAEGLLQLGRAEAALDILQRIDAPALHNARRRLLAWALFATEAYRGLEALLRDDAATAADPELAFLRDVAGLELGDDTALARLRGRWRSEPDSTFGLLALRAAAAHDPRLSRRDRQAVLTALPAPSASSRFGDEAALALALGALHTALPDGGALEREVDYALGVLELRAERFSRATTHLHRSLLSRDTDVQRAARYHLALAEQRRGHHDVARRELRRLAERNDRYGVLALAAQGQMAIETANYDDARRLFTAHLFESPLAGAREQALWGLGWVAYRTGAFAEARRFFTTLVRESPYGALAAAALYFAARSAQEIGRDADARLELCLVRRRFPTDYYAYRAARRTSDTTACAGIDREKTPSELTQARRYLDAGMHHRAERAVRPLLARLATLGPESLEQLHAVLAVVGLPVPAAEVEELLVERFARGSGVDERLAAPFRKSEAQVLRAAAETERLDPELVLALARAKSGLTLAKVGKRGELGPFQLPRPAMTLLWREERRSRTAVSGDLLAAATAVRLGTRYVGRLVRAFGPKVEYALAALHARPGAVTRWRERRGELPGEIFVEEIPYADTKAFVKAVLAAVQTQAVVLARQNAVRLAQAPHGGAPQ